MSKTNSLGTDFTEGKVMPMLLKFFLPFLLANLLNNIYNTVDMVIIGQFVGSSGTVAVSQGGKMLSLFSLVGTAFAGGGQVLISQLIGARRRNELNSTIGTLFSELLILSVFFAGFTLVFSRQILTWLNTPEESFEAALAYLRITAIGLPLTYGYNAVSAMLRGMGDSKSPLIFVAIAAVLNLIGDLVFIIAFRLGAAGTAIATIMGQGVSLVFSLITLYRRREQFGFDFKLKSFAIDWGKLRIISRLGLPVALRTFCIIATQLVLLRFINEYGVNEAAAYSIGDKIVHLANIFTMAAKQASGAMVGQNIGADRPDRVKQIFRSSMIITITSATLLAIASLISPEFIFSLFTKDEGVLHYARSFMYISVLIYFLSAYMGPTESIITGTGHSLLSFIGGMLDGVVFRVCFSFLFAWGLDMGAAGFYLGDALARLGPILVGSIYYFSGAWQKRKKLTEA